MGQLESYTIHDIYLASIVSGLLSTYLAEEIEATIESVVPYLYSGNACTSKKRQHIKPALVPAGDVIGAMHNTYNFLRLTKTNFISIEKPINDRLM